MENIEADIDTMMESDDLELPESDDHSSSFEPKTLLDLPVEVIEMILSHLNLKDKKNFGLTSKKSNNILSNCADLWENVWLRVPDQETPKASELTRKYVNVTCVGNSFNNFANDGIFAHLAPNLKSLTVVRRFNFILSLKCLTSTLPFFKNLFHLDFFIGIDSLQDDIDKSTAIDENLQAVVPVEMKKLKNLTMTRSVFLKLNGRFINFSTNALKTLILYKVDDDYGEYDEKVIASLVERQKNLEIFKLDLKYGVIFDKLLKSNAQLKEIDLKLFLEDLNAHQQNNMWNFLHSQKRLQQQRFDWYGQKTDRMLDYQMRLLNSTVAKQWITIRIQNNSGIQRNFWCIDSEILRIDLFSTEFLSYPHKENLYTVNLRLDIVKFTTVAEVESVITRICETFPNLKDLGIELVGGNREALSSINLSNLGRLEKLESLKLVGFTLYSSLFRWLDNVTIPSLKKFVINPNFLALRNCTHVKNFMTRHVDLNCMEFGLRVNPSSTMSEVQAVTEIFENSGFYVEMNLLNMTVYSKSYSQNYCN